MLDSYLQTFLQRYKDPVRYKHVSADLFSPFSSSIESYPVYHVSGMTSVTAAPRISSGGEPQRGQHLELESVIGRIVRLETEFLD